MLQVETLKIRNGFGSNCYLISSQGEYAVIDPSVHYSLANIDGKIKYVLLTHSHFDHILQIDSWVEQGAEVLISAHEQDFLKDPMKNCYGLFLKSQRGYFGKTKPIYDGDVILLGSERIQVMETPGHTCGSVCYVSDGMIFVGDTVFSNGGYGRCDLPSGDPMLLFSSIDKLKKFPENTLLYPGHDRSFTIEELKLHLT